MQLLVLHRLAFNIRRTTTFVLVDTLYRMPIRNQHSVISHKALYCRLLTLHQIRLRGIIDH